MKAIDKLVDSFASFPGIGRKSAARMVYHLLGVQKEFCYTLAERITNLVDVVQYCSTCGAYSEADLCPICADNGRDRTVICVVEQAQDIFSLETTHEFHGLYHVLHGVIAPMQGIGPQQLSTDALVKRVHKEKVQEIILATNPTVEGDITARYIKELLQDTVERISRIALGMPVGGDLEYADRMTIARSLRARTTLD